jgi:hypothetical protein
MHAQHTPTCECLCLEDDLLYHQLLKVCQLDFSPHVQQNPTGIGRGIARKIVAKRPERHIKQIPNMLQNLFIGMSPKVRVLSPLAVCFFSFSPYLRVGTEGVMGPFCGLKDPRERPAEDVLASVKCGSSSF